MNLLQFFLTLLVSFSNIAFASCNYCVIVPKINIVSGQKKFVNDYEIFFNQFVTSDITNQMASIEKRDRLSLRSVNKQMRDDYVLIADSIVNLDLATSPDGTFKNDKTQLVNNSIKDGNLIARHISLQNNSANYSQDFVKRFQKFLQNGILKQVGVSFANLPPSCMLSIEKQLPDNSRLLSVGAKNSALTFFDNRALSEIIKKSPKLQVMDIRDTNITDYTAKLLADNLKTNNSLTSIDLCGGLITDVGALQLATALKTNTTLKILDLYNNNISPQGIVALEAGVKDNTVKDRAIFVGGQRFPGTKDYCIRRANEQDKNIKNIIDYV